jgi:ABC-type lipoprotein release transport system permease subunit
MILRLALRGLLRNPRRTLVVGSAVAVGIAGCSLAIALNSGMAAQMIETAIATELGHLQIHAQGFEQEPQLGVLLADGGAGAARAVEDAPGVRAFALRVRGQGLVHSPRSSVGVRVVAVQPDAEARVSAYARSLREGEWLTSARGRAVLGASLARRLHVEPGDKIVLSVQDLAGDLTAQAFRVGGLFRTASRPIDDSTVLVRLDEGQELFGVGGGVSEIVVLSDEPGTVDALSRALGSALAPGAEVRSWKELQPLLVHLVQMMDRVAWVIYASVFIAMAFGIANVLLMSIYERTREIGVMMAVGMKPRRIVLSVVAESMLVTGLGLAAGLAAGLSWIWLLQDGIDLGFYADGLEALGVGAVIRPVIRANDLAAPVVMAAIAALLASAWPASRAARLRPGEALRRA